MSTARKLSPGLLALSLLTALPVAAAEPSHDSRPLTLWLDACLAQNRDSIEQVVSLELDRTVASALQRPQAPVEQVTVECGADALTLRYVRDGSRQTRSLDLRNVSDKALARTVALSVVELVEAPENVQPVPTPSPAASARPTRVARETKVARAALLGTARIFPATSDLTWGARLRSRFLGRGRGAFLLGIGGETGSAARAPGHVSVTVAYGELGFGYDLWRRGVVALALEALGEAGYVVLKGTPSAAATTEGQRLKAGWIDLQLAFAPRLRLTSALDLTSRAGVGIMLLGPSATFDSKQLDVWHGVSASFDLGLALSL